MTTSNGTGSTSVSESDAGEAGQHPEPTPAPTYVVGVGASAGGLEALEEFFEHMPSGTGLAFVVVQHLSPDFKSLMDEILARKTEMRVRRVEDRMSVEPDTIYLIPPRKELIISGGKLLLNDRDADKSLTLPIDIFFRSLASDLGDQSVAVVLSGTGSDGSRGLLDVHTAGGVVAVQEPESAKFDGMPRSAVDTGVADIIGSPRELPSLILKCIDYSHKAEIPPTSEGTEQDGIQQITSLLRRAYSVDFSQYKQTTIRRRIERRLLLNRSVDIGAYVDRLAADPAELRNLYHDLLIGVTKFFRDKEAFERLRSELIPQILERTESKEDIRVWVAGCATGEEAYSIAIVLREQLADGGRPLNVKIFATDIDRGSLEFASAGTYPEASLSEVEPERIKRHFRRTERGYEVDPDLRKMIVFAPHNVIKDAPFTKLDLVTCRNLLIYLQPQIQKKVISLFHFGLKTGGALFLGPSESPGDLAAEFEPVDRQQKIYRKKRDVRLPADLRMPLSSVIGVRPVGPHKAPAQEERLVKAQQSLIGRYSPPSILVNATYEVLHTFSGGGSYLSCPDGKSTMNVLDMVDSELKLILHAGLQRAGKKRAVVEYAGVNVARRGSPERRRVLVTPIEEHDSFGFLISLEDESVKQTRGPALEVKMDEISRDRIVELERELQHTRENLQATLEEMETANEELQATNEELVASNEELQSTNEELHSVNEELYTVNAEHQKKIAELTELTEDMENLFAATDVATVFLDAGLRVRKFTPAVAEVFRLMPQDIGRRIDGFAHNLDIPELVTDLEHVLESEEPIERQVANREGAWFLLRVIPYRVGPVVDGVVMSLVNISSLKLAEHKLRLMSKVFMDAADPIIVEDLSGSIIDLNEEAVRVYGYERDELLGKSIELLIPDRYQARGREARRRCLEKEYVRNVESVRRDKAGKTHPVLLTLSLLMEEDGGPIAIASIAKDISRRKEAEREARRAVRKRDEFLAMLSHELRNPLGAARNATHLLQSENGDPKTARRAAAVVHRQIDQMARLLDDLLDVTRITQNKVRLYKERMDVVAAARDAAEAVRPMFEKRGQELVLELPSGPVEIDGDPARIRQVQENLLVNASKYTYRNGRVVMEVTRAGPDAVIRVRDNGRGIPEDQLDNIFELFSQAEEGIDRSDGGMGVGLTLARDLAKMHRGEIRAESGGLDQGSLFEVRLPMLRGGAKRARKKPRRRVAPNVSLEGLTVALVEDNDDARETLKVLLERDGCRVVAAPDGAAGVQAIVESTPRVALIDIGLPRMDGYEVARQVRSKLNGAPVRLVALTGYGRKEDREAVRAAGFDEHLVKPVSHERLYEVLRQGASEMIERNSKPISEQ